METSKFQDMFTTAKGEKRASVTLNSLETLWFNTGTLCNLECKNCYIESSPKNDRLSYLTVNDVLPYLEEIQAESLGTKLIGLTGGEPFLNPSIIQIISTILTNGFDILILTNANRVIKKHQNSLLALKNEYGDKLHIRISLDHFSAELHDKERGHESFDRTIEQMKWLYDSGINISIASRSLKDEAPSESIDGHKKLLKSIGINLDLKNKLVVFPEMKSGRDVPEITTDCWNILDIKADDQMCASERMIIKRKGESQAKVMPCTLLAYDEKFVLGENLKHAKKEVYLNHKFCAEFCVLGGASCSGTK
ncbi:MAG: radical SAM protein [Bdellovibrionales bacterium]|jgi:MoaA/NifB/PqqE/SkfB family radical SAM enzyme|nr:radical SAM protein [Bdellovibrionales bacterium]